MTYQNPPQFPQQSNPYGVPHGGSYGGSDEPTGQPTYPHGPYGGAYGNGPYRGYEQGSGYEPGAGAPHPRKKRRTLWIVLAAVAVVVLALGTWGGFWLFGKFGGARNPEAAVDNYLESVASFDVVDALLSTAPSEQDIIKDAAMQLRDAELGAIEGEDESIPSVFESLQDAGNAVSVSREDFEYEVEEVAEGVEVVTITSGTIVVDGDEDALREALENVAMGLAYEGAIAAGESHDSAVEQAEDARRGAADDVELPYETDIEELLGSSFGFEDGLPVVTVQENGGWYVSPIMTGTNFFAVSFAAGMSGQPGGVASGGEVVEPRPSESPEEAGMQAVDGFADIAESVNGAPGDLELMGSALSEAERRLYSLFLLPALEGIAESAGQYGVGTSLQLSVSGDFESFEFGGKTMILPSNLEISDGEFGITFDGYCFETLDSYSQAKECLTDWDGFDALGFDELGIVVVQEFGGWVVSPYETVEIFLETATDRYLELREDGELDRLFG